MQNANVLGFKCLPSPRPVSPSEPASLPAGGPAHAPCGQTTQDVLSLRMQLQLDSWLWCCALSLGGGWCSLPEQAYPAGWGGVGPCSGASVHSSHQAGGGWEGCWWEWEVGIWHLQRQTTHWINTLGSHAFLTVHFNHRLCTEQHVFSLASSPINWRKPCPESPTTLKWTYYAFTYCLSQTLHIDMSVLHIKQSLFDKSSITRLLIDGFQHFFPTSPMWFKSVILIWLYLESLLLWIFVHSQTSDQIWAQTCMNVFVVAIFQSIVLCHLFLVT